MKSTPTSHLVSPGSILIKFISDPTAPTWWGFLLAGLMFVSSMMQVLILHQYFHCIFVTALRLRTAIIGVIYRKVSQRVGHTLEEVSYSDLVGRSSWAWPTPHCSFAGSGHHQLS